MELNAVKAGMEAVLFAHADPLSAERLADILEIEVSLCERLLMNLRDECEKEERGVQLIRLENAWQFTTKANYGEAVQKALNTKRNAPLSAAALEVLAIVAYNQPVSRSFVEQVRGVDSSAVVVKLCEKGLVCEAGRLDLPGKPISYKTTDLFLRSFGIHALSELPPLHREDSQEDESDLYARVSAENTTEEMPADMPTRALRGGMFIEGEKGAAALVEDEDEPWPV